jgi:predicted MFS family arabinose efflux permease
VLQNRWVMLAVLFTVRTVMGFQFQAVASLGPSLLEALAIDNAQLGLLIGFYLLPGLPIALPGGMIGQRFGGKQVALLGLVLMALGGFITGAAATFGIAAGGRLIAGTGAVLLNIMLTKLVADWFADHKPATAMGILATSWPLGIALGLAFSQSLASRFGWAAVLQLAAGLSALALGLVLAIYRDPPGLKATASTRFNLGLTGYELRMVSLAGFLWAAYNAGYIVLTSFAALFLAARGYSLEQSGWVASLLGWAMIPMVPLGGYLADRAPRPNLATAAGLILTFAGIVAMALGDAPVPWLIAVACLSGLPAGAIMILPVKVLRPDIRAAGMGIFYTLFYAGMGALPALAGMARDRTGSAAAPLLCAAALYGLTLILLAMFWGLERHGMKRQVV